MPRAAPPLGSGSSSEASKSEVRSEASHGLAEELRTLTEQEVNERQRSHDGRGHPRAPPELRTLTEREVNERHRARASASPAEQRAHAEDGHERRRAGDSASSAELRTLTEEELHERHGARARIAPEESLGSRSSGSRGSGGSDGRNFRGAVAGRRRSQTKQVADFAHEASGGDHAVLSSPTASPPYAAAAPSSPAASSNGGRAPSSPGATSSGATRPSPSRESPSTRAPPLQPLQMPVSPAAVCFPTNGGLCGPESPLAICLDAVAGATGLAFDKTSQARATDSGRGYYHPGLEVRPEPTVSSMARTLVTPRASAPLADSMYRPMIGCLCASLLTLFLCLVPFLRTGLASVAAGVNSGSSPILVSAPTSAPPLLRTTAPPPASANPDWPIAAGVGTAGTGALAFDCGSEMAVWRSAWSSEKMGYCCRHKGIGCLEGEEEPTATPTHRYDCEMGISTSAEEWAEGAVAAPHWSPQKASWCCQHTGRGCDYAASLPAAVAAASSHAELDTETAQERVHNKISTDADPELPSGCSANCSLGGVLGSCRDHIQFVSTHPSVVDMHACNVAHDLVLEHCSSCSACSLVDAGCTGLQKDPTSPLSYDCNNGYIEWRIRWSAGKQAWCCLHANRGCRTTSTESPWSAVETTATVPPEISEAVLDLSHESYDCSQGAEAWNTWAEEQRNWCCEVEGRGCLASVVMAPATDALFVPSDCGPGEGRAQGWSEEKKVYCCGQVGRGCPSAAGSEVAYQQ
mmetsp:Transcript_1980/g.4742  ORF Transcript_1980/g.4742 Transcript_1980/m.4742 type:complete len:749 (+) Transcript_1980:79-2325(+)